MNIDIADVLFHIPVNLPERDRVNIERDLQGCDGVVSAHFSPRHAHMLEVAYNPHVVTTATLRGHLVERGLMVSMAGL